jgi:S1-C subfamily serine protease
VEAAGMMAIRCALAWLPLARLCVGTVLAVLGGSEQARAQAAKASKDQAGTVPQEAAAIVVGVTSYFYEERTPEFGAGIIFGTNGRELYIATAGHVVQRDTVASTIWVRFVEGDSVRATLVHTMSDSLFDLAVLSVTGDPVHLKQWTPDSWDRQGSARGLQGDDPVSPVGCPQGVCWRAPRPPDRVIGKLESSILFQSFFVRRGSSGGALFNRWWEVVGIVIKDEPPLGNAIPIDTVLAQVKAWGFPVALKQPPVPRGGYRTTVGAVVMTSTSSAATTGDTRVPSGRVAMVRQFSPLVTWHVAGLRLAPENLAVSAGMAGVGVHLKRGRLGLDLFVEAGFGHIEARHDIGGSVVDMGGVNTYVPFYNRLEDDGLGVGGGVAAQVIVVSPMILEVVTGYWSFTTPENAPNLRNLFVGGGLRLGL